MTRLVKPGVLATTMVAMTLSTALATALLAGCATEARPEAKDLHEEVVHVDVTVEDRKGERETRSMPVTIYRPEGAGPFPLVVFNHGRATSDKRAAQGRARPEAFARYLVAKHFVVLVPTRIGYWETYGDFDPESAGSCNDLHPEAMARAASDQVLATVDFAKTLPYVDARRWIVAGVSVGGLASIATVGRHPDGLVGAINFSGGAGGNPTSRPGRSCGPDRIAALYRGSAAGGTVPMRWFYWSNDLFWGADAPRAWFGAWRDGGGDGEFTMFPAIGRDGHAGFAIDMAHWSPVVDRFIDTLGFAPVASGSARGDATVAHHVEVLQADASLPRLHVDPGDRDGGPHDCEADATRSGDAGDPIRGRASADLIPDGPCSRRS